MRYLNPAPDEKTFRRLYGNGAVDPVNNNPGHLSQVSRKRPAVSGIRSFVHVMNDILRGHPHDWPAEEGKGRSILDFGCHDGSKLAYWYQRGWQVAGVDLNEPAVDVARQRFPDGAFWCGDLLRMDISERFDCIRSDNVIEHLHDPVPYLETLARLLKPGGLLRVFVPNGAALSARLVGRYSYVYWTPFHLNVFSQETLRLALERAGLVNISCSVFTPIGSWTHTQRQLLLSPGFNRRTPTLLDKVIRWAWLLNYPGETIAQWVGLGEEIVGTARYNPEASQV